MSKGKTSQKSAMPGALHRNLAPLFQLLGDLGGHISEEDQKQLVEDFLNSCPETWPASLPSPVRTDDAPPTPPLLETIRLGPAHIWESLLDFQDAFTTLEASYPLRAAALYLRSLTRIWVELVENRRLDILSEEEFLRLYLDAMLRVEAIASRCACCTQRANVNPQ